MYTFNNLYEKYKAYYIQSSSLNKFHKVQQKIHSSAKIAELLGQSIRAKVAPSMADYATYIVTIPYFVFASSETNVMAGLIAIAHWDDQVNRLYNLCSDFDLYNTGDALLRKWKISFVY